MRAILTIDDCMLLGHDAEPHDPNTATMPSKIADKPDIMWINNIGEPCIKIMSIINETNLNIIYKREGVAPGGLALLPVAMSFGGHFGQPVPIAAHRPIGQFVPYQQMRGNRMGWPKRPPKPTCHGKFVVPW